jgi:hypothetical protein
MQRFGKIDRPDEPRVKAWDLCFERRSFGFGPTKRSCCSVGASLSFSQRAESDTERRQFLCCD